MLDTVEALSCDHWHWGMCDCHDCCCRRAGEEVKLTVIAADGVQGDCLHVEGGIGGADHRAEIGSSMSP